MRTQTGNPTKTRTSFSHPSQSANRSPTRHLDVLIVGGLAVLAAIVAFTLPAGDPARFALTLPVLLIAPGYLLIQAFIPDATGRTRLVHGLLSIGVSPAVVGLLALSTALIPGGFGATSIIAAVTLWCLIMASIAMLRRTLRPVSPAATAQVAQTSSK